MVTLLFYLSSAIIKDSVSTFEMLKSECIEVTVGGATGSLRTASESIRGDRTHKGRASFLCRNESESAHSHFATFSCHIHQINVLIMY